MDLSDIPNIPTNPQVPPISSTPPSKKRLFYLIIGLALVIIVIELVWAYSVFYKSPNATIVNQVVNTQSTVNSIATITLTSSKQTLKVGENFVVAIDVKTKRLTDAMDLVLKYDPKVLEASSSAITGNLYDQYPVNKVDASLGVITVSGITSEQNGIIPNGVFGYLTFKAKAQGQSKISVDFTPNTTNDSNIIEAKTGKDVLSSVNNLELNISQ